MEEWDAKGEQHRSAEWNVIIILKIVEVQREQLGELLVYCSVSWSFLGRKSHLVSAHITGSC